MTIYRNLNISKNEVETSKKLGMSQVQVSRKESKVLEKLKQKMCV